MEQSLRRIIFNGLNVRLFVCASCLLFSSLSFSMSLINPDFNAGFLGWSGEIVSDSNFLPTIINPDSSPFNFSTTPGSATVATNNAAFDIFSVVLFQDFLLDPIATGSVLELSLNVTQSLTSPSDFTFVQLRDTSGVLGVLDLIAGGTYDISNWIGVSAAFEFGVVDTDFLLPDSLTVSNISIFERAADVPAPASLWLIGLGLVFLRRRLILSQVIK